MAKIRNQNIADVIGTDKIKSLHLYVPSNIEGLTLEPGTAELTIISDNAANWAKDTPFEVYDNGGKILGHYYVDECNKQNKNEYKVLATDRIGRLQNQEFLGYFENYVWYPSAGNKQTGKTVSQVLGYIFDSTDEYDLDDALTDIIVPGLIPRTDCRDALRYLCLAIGACAHTFRTDKVKIVPSDVSDVIYINSNRFMSDLMIDKNSNYASGITVTTHEYDIPTGGGVIQRSTVFAGYLPVGVNIVSDSTTAKKYSSEKNTTDYILHGYSVGGYSEIKVLDSTGVSVKIELSYLSPTYAPAITINGIKYCFTEIAGMPATHTEDKIEIGYGDKTTIDSGATIITPNSAQSICARLFGHLSKKNTANFTFVLEDEDIESTLEIADETYFGKICGRILSLDIDMGTSKNFAKAIILCEEESA